MSKRIKVRPPSGGEPIEIYEVDSVHFVSKGWTVEGSAKIEIDLAIETENETDEGLSNGNIQRKQRNRKGRV